MKNICRVVLDAFKEIRFLIIPKPEEKYGCLSDSSCADNLQDRYEPRGEIFVKSQYWKDRP